ncbi:MAG: hypothetical protein IJA10_03805 [Lachnospiraceae bacterium]|nr:hypothetical protein [Lachnospiraceae bacterium]
MGNEGKETIYSTEKRNKSHVVDDKKTGLTKEGKVFLTLIVFVMMFWLAAFAGQRIGEDLGTFIYNISH